MEAGHLQPDEQVQTLAGLKQVASITPHPDNETVYNLEVQGEHVYLVGSLGTLVHNNYFPENADDLLSSLPRNHKGQIFPSNKIRIRPEKHDLLPGETYAPRHHGQHYHVEIRNNPNISWNNRNNVTKVLPPNYVPGEGTGFLPGELFPGL